MELANMLRQVDTERIYQHVLKLQGTRHPMDTPEKLNQSADYLHTEFERYGLIVEEQTFEVPGFHGKFRNVEAATSHSAVEEFLIVAHYDTVENCPGANDNASGMAVMLEASRVLAQAGVDNVRFVGFSLEELNPAFALESRRLAQSLGLRDTQNQYTSFHTHRMMNKLFELERKHWITGMSHGDALASASAELRNDLSKAELDYVSQLLTMYGEITPASWAGKIAGMGSAHWVDEAMRTGRKVRGVICFETIGYTSQKEHSQSFPAGMKPEMFQADKLSNATIGNFIAAIGDVNSGRLVQSFAAQSAPGSVDLPCAALQVPLNYQQIALSGMVDLLRSDHAPFWRVGIPALFVTDTADFRYPYYHTPADTIEKLDFEFMTKICKATVATVKDLTMA